MLRLNIFRSRFLLALTISCFTLIMLPLDGLAKGVSPTGAIVGFIYGGDMGTPVKDAIVKVRSLENGEEYVSTPTDANGAFKINELKEGSYVLGVSASDGDYNLNYAVRVKGGEIGKLSLALKSGEAVSQSQEGSMPAKEKVSFFRTPVGVVVLMVASTLGLYGIFKLIEGDEPVSPSSVH